MSLSKIRRKIDSVDSEIIKMLNERAKLASQVANFKTKNKLDIYSAEREALILGRLKKISHGPLQDSDIEIIFREILSVCRALRVILNVVYLGPEGTFTHLAAIRRFGKRGKFIPAHSIREVFERVDKEDIDCGVVPVENSIEGVVNYTLDMFLEFELKICSEIILSISHSLLRLSGKEKLIRIYSNPHVFSQCRNWLIREYPKAQLIPTATTAKAAEMARKDVYGACIGSRMLATLYKLKEINLHIEDSSSNITRFLIVSKKDSLPSGRDKTSILFSIKDKVGALYDALNSFRKEKINLTKIESRPSKRKPWDYCFFVDFEGHSSEPRIRRALKNLKEKCVFLRILGSYPRES
ncbi:MAG: prephenate dehydratase [Candidatus Omnitrophota bacterium]